LAYVEQRASTIKKLRWELGPLPTDEVKTSMSHLELAFFQEYDQILTKHFGTIELDLTENIMPPKDLFVQVLVLRDCGEVMTESGSVLLEKGTTHSLKRREIEHLVRQGYLEEHQQHESC
jgi:GINS complex subunit 1